MRKLSVWIVVAVMVLSSLACRVSFNPPEDLNLPDFNLQTLVPGLPQDQDGDIPQQQEPTSSDPEDTADATPLPAPQYTREATNEPFVTGAEVGELEERDQLLVSLYEHVSPGVVQIQTFAEEGQLGLGSGFVFDNQGHIVTNYHVVEGATEVEVDFPSGYKALGEVIGTDIDSDLAVIKVDAEEGMLFPLPLGDSDQLRVGQSVVAIGNPFGLSGTITLGIVSAKGRTLESLRQSNTGNFFSAGDIIQTDASINPGNSGGPLLNLNGEVVGINRAIRTTGTTNTGDPVNSGIGFAISINIVKRVVPYLIEYGEYDYPYLGISAAPELSLVLRERLNINRYTGAYVTFVEPGGPADEAGIQAAEINQTTGEVSSGGDLIIGVDDREVLVFGDLLSYLMTNKSPGDQITLRIVRDGEEMEVPLTLGKRP